MADATTIVREYIDAWNRRDWEKFRSLIGSGYSYTGGDGVKNDGIEAGCDQFIQGADVAEIAGDELDPGR